VNDQGGNPGNQYISSVRRPRLERDHDDQKYQYIQPVRKPRARRAPAGCTRRSHPRWICRRHLPSILITSTTRRPVSANDSTAAGPADWITTPERRTARRRSRAERDHLHVTALERATQYPGVCAMTSAGAQGLLVRPIWSGGRFDGGYRSERRLHASILRDGLSPSCPAAPRRSGRGWMSP